MKTCGVPGPKQDSQNTSPPPPKASLSYSLRLHPSINIPWLGVIVAVGEVMVPSCFQVRQGREHREGGGQDAVASVSRALRGITASSTRNLDSWVHG